MKKRNIKGVVAASLVIMSSLTFTGCKDTRKSLLEYKDSSISDEANIGKIITSLPADEYCKDFELKSSEPPYEINIDYSDFDEAEVKLSDGTTIEQSFNETIQKNAMILFSLVNDVEAINFTLENGSIFSYKKTELAYGYREKFGEDFESIIEDETTFNDFLKKEMFEDQETSEGEEIS